MKTADIHKYILLLLLSHILVITGLNAQKYGATPEDSLECIKNISLYREYYKGWQRKNYESEAVYDVIKPWRWVFINCPMATQNTYINGVKIMEYMIDHAQTPEQREKYIDTLMMIYDRRMQYFNNEGEILGRKGVDLCKLRPDSVKVYYHILRKSVSLEKNASNDVVVIYYFRAAIKYVLEGYADKSLIVETYDEVSDIVNHNIKYSTENASRYLIAKSDIELNFEPFSACENLVDVYGKKFQNNPNDTFLLQKITKILNMKNCKSEELFFKATKKLFAISPTGESGYLMGVMNFQKEAYSESVCYLEEAVKIIDDKDKKADAYLLLAETYKRLKQYPLARTNALNAIELRPNEGNAYIMIGDMYAESAIDCVENEKLREFESKAPYWAAVDKYIKAKEVDKSIEDIANKRIDFYSQYFPSDEIIFFINREKGQTYEVGCWIRETTIIR